MSICKVVTILLAITAAGLSSTAPCAQTIKNYPDRPIRLIVPFPPGGGADVLSRILSPHMSKALGQQIVVDNRGGAGGNIGVGLAAKAPPDGYTLVFAYAGVHAINPHLYSQMPFQESDFAPVIWLSSVPQVLVVHPSLAVKNLKELIALAKAKPGQLTFGSGGNGTIHHLAGELFKMMTGTELVHVPFKGGGPVAIALLSGEINLIFAEPATIVGHIRSGKVRPIAVTTTRRALAFPELPTFAESGLANYEVVSWNGMLVPASTPKEIIERLNTEYNRIISTPDMRKLMLANGYEVVGGPPEKFGEQIHAEIEKWGRVVKASGAKID